MVIRVMNIALPNPTGRRILAGQGKHLVVTDGEEQHAAITELLPIMDKPLTEPTEDRQFLEMVQTTVRYIQGKKKTMLAAEKASGIAAPSAAPSSSGGGAIRTYDLFKSTRSIYAEDDAKIVNKTRKIEEEVHLPSLTNLTLKGIFQSSKGSVALLSYSNIIFTAKEGGLFEGSNQRIKGVSSKVIKDHVVLIGPDNIPREFRFKSSL